MAPISTTLISRSPEVTTPSLTVNLVFRVFLAVLANLSCWVPLKHLHRHGEFAASVLVYSVVILNALTFINALTWRNDDIQKWWRGNVWCDIHPYIYQPALSVYTTSIVAIMHNLAQQVGLLRASPLTVLEKRRRMWNQALIIFSLPVIQMAWIYPLTKQRFMIGTLKGCTWISYPSWPFLVFFLLPTPILALVSGFYSVVTFKRYMQIERTTRAALLSSSSAATRANRTRRRLFLMTLCILVPFIPTVLALCFIQIRATIPLQAFDFRQIHPDDNLWPWHSITFYTHDELTFFDLNYNYLVILTGIPIFFFFGLKKDTKEIYHRFLVSIYLDRIFPGLRVEPSLDGPRPGLEASDGLQIVVTPTKPPDQEPCQAVHVSQVLPKHESVSSPPPPYSSRVDSPVDASQPSPAEHHGSNDMFIMPVSPEPCTTATRDRLSGSENVESFGQTTNHGDDWLPRLALQPDLTVMIQAHIAHSTDHT